MRNLTKLGGLGGLLLLQASRVLAAADVQELPSFSNNSPILRGGTSWMLIGGVLALTIGGLLAYVYFREWQVTRLYRRGKSQPAPRPEEATAAVTAATPRRETIIQSSTRARQNTVSAANPSRSAISSPGARTASGDRQRGPTVLANN